MANHVYRPCCEAGAADGRGYIFEPDKPPEGVDLHFHGDDDPMETTPHRSPPPPSIETCQHEAGHALALHAMGYRIDEVRVGSRNFVRRADGEGERMANGEQVVSALAGDLAGQMVDGRRPYIHEPPQIAKALARVETGCHGTCDDCIAGVFAIHIANKSPGAIPADVFRNSEIRAADILLSDNGPRAIRALGFKLQQAGQLSGDEVHQYLDLFVAFGSFK